MASIQFMEFMQFTKPPNFCSIFFGVTTLSFRGVGVSGNFFSGVGGQWWICHASSQELPKESHRKWARGCGKVFSGWSFLRLIASNTAQSAAITQNAKISHKISINGYIIPQRLLHHKHAKTTQSPQKPPNCRARDPLRRRYRRPDRRPTDDDQPAETANGGSGEDVRTHARGAKKRE